MLPVLNREIIVVEYIILPVSNIIMNNGGRTGNATCIKQRYNSGRTCNTTCIKQMNNSNRTGNATYIICLCVT